MTANRTLFVAWFDPKRRALMPVGRLVHQPGPAAQGSTLETYASIYLWNQPEAENNHTPAWDVFKIPPADPPR